FFSQLNSARAPQYSGCRLVREHVQLRAIAVGHCQFRTRSQALQSLNSLDAVAFSFLVATQTPGEPGHPAEVISLPQVVAQSGPDLKSFAARFQGFLYLIRQEAFIRAA